MSRGAQRETWVLLSLFGVGIACSIAVSFFVSWTAVLALVVLVAACVAFMVRPEWGVYALACAAPMGGLIVDFSRERTLSRLPYIGSINASLVDFIGILLLIVIVGLFFSDEVRIRISRLKEHAWFFVVWFGAVALSVVYGDHAFLGISVKAFARPYLFTYIAFVVPVILLTYRRIHLEKALLAYEWAALAGAVMGFVSIFIVPAVGFVRAQPFEIFGFAPFGLNHNILAESLTAIIPFAWWYSSRLGDHRDRSWAAVGAGLLTVVSLLTFSRAAWIVVCLQAVTYFLWKRRGSPYAKGSRYLVAGVACALMIFFVWIQSTAIAESSDNTRKDLLGIALTYFERAPVFGQGPGTFVPLVQDTALFRMEYGDALDAHGVYQKVLTETGIVGTVAFTALVGALMYKLWKRRSDSFYVMLTMTVGSMWVYQLFNTGYFAGKVWVLMGISIAALLV